MKRIKKHDGKKYIKNKEMTRNEKDNSSLIWVDLPASPTGLPGEQVDTPTVQTMTIQADTKFQNPCWELLLGLEDLVIRIHSTHVRLSAHFRRPLQVLTSTSSLPWSSLQELPPSFGWATPRATSVSSISSMSSSREIENTRDRVRQSPLR